MDEKLIKAWSGHPHHYIIENPSEGGFKAKMALVHDAVCKTVGVPIPHSYFKKFLLKMDVDGNFIFDKKIKTQIFNVEETILKTEEEGCIESKVRSRG